MVNVGELLSSFQTENFMVPGKKNVSELNIVKNSCIHANKFKQNKLELGWGQP